MASRLVYGQVQLSAMNWPIYCASELDLFAAHDLAVEAKIFTSPLEPVTALKDGSLDLINVIPDVALLEMIRGAPFSLIANTNTRAQYRLMVRSDIREYADLREKKIGVNDGRSAEALILTRLLRQRGLDASSYELVPSGPPPERCAKLKQGLLAATMVTQPFDFALEEAGFSALASSSETVPHYPFTVSVVRQRDAVDEKILSFLQSLKTAWQWLADRAQRQRAAEILSRFTKTPVRQAEATYDLYLTPPSPPSLAPTQEGVAVVLELLAESGRLPYPLPTAQRFIDERYFEKVTSNE